MRLVSSRWTSKWFERLVRYSSTAGSQDSMKTVSYTHLDRAVSEKIVEKGDIVVITAGIPISTVGSTNLIKAQVID